MLHDTAVVTLAIQNGRALNLETWDHHPFAPDDVARLLQYSAPTHRHYANRIGADYVPITDRLHPDWHVFYEKLQMGKMLDLNGYRRILYVDGDVVIRGDTRNVFDLVPVGKMGVFNETPVLGDEALTRIHELLGFVGGPPRDWTWNKIYFCAGVLVLDQSHSRLLREIPWGQMLHLRHGDQGWLNLRTQLSGTPMFELPENLHFMPMIHPGAMIQEMAAENEIIHLAGFPLATRVEMMRQIVEIWEGTYR